MKISKQRIKYQKPSWPDLLKYPPKILIALGETIAGGKDILEWFLKTGILSLQPSHMQFRGVMKRRYGY